MSKSLTESSPPIYFLPGMTAHYPVYSRLFPLLPNAKLFEFIAPQSRETLVHYASRMAESIPGNAIIGGVSFGGMVALEIARILQPRGCILISTVQHPKQLPLRLRVLRQLPGIDHSMLMQLTGGMATLVPRQLQTSGIVRAAKLSGEKGNWYRWASGAILGWKPQAKAVACPLLQIHGTADTTFPIAKVTPDVIISGGRHALPISHPKETAAAIQSFVEEVDKKRICHL